MTTNPIFVGVDVAKEVLDVALRPSGEGWRVPNDAAGVAALVARLRPLGPALIVCEATGGFERAAIAALAAARLPVVVANPRQVRDFARATGQLAKTDQLDAGLLALFAERVRPAPRPLPDAAAQLLDAVLTRRRQLLEMLTAEKNRLGFAPQPLHRGIQAHIRWLERQLDEVTKELAGLIEASPVWRAKDDLLQGVQAGAQHSDSLKTINAPSASKRPRKSPTTELVVGLILCQSGRRDLNPRPPEPHTLGYSGQLRQRVVTTRCSGHRQRKSKPEDQPSVVRNSQRNSQRATP